MQGQRSSIGSLPEILNFDHGSSSSSNTALDQQICWNGMQRPADNQINLLAPSNMNITYANSVNLDQENLSRWSLGEPSSSNSQSEVNREGLKAETGWSSSASPCTGAGPRLQDQHYEPSNSISLDSVNVSNMFMRSSDSEVVPQNLNLDGGLLTHGGSSNQILDGPNMFKSNRQEHGWNPSPSAPGSFVLPSGNNGFLVEGNDSRAGPSVDGCRASCKRKALEGSVAQSSASGRSIYSQHTDGSAESSLSSSYNAGANLRISGTMDQQANPRFGPSSREVNSDYLRGSSLAENLENPRRNLRVRLNPPTQQGTNSHTLFSTENTARNSGISSSQLSGGPLSIEPAIDNLISQSQPVIIHVPNLRSDVQSLRWNGGASSSRSGGSLNSVGNRPSIRHAGSNLRSMSGNILENNPVFVPATELRNMVRNSTYRTLPSENASIPGGVASTSRTTPNSVGPHPPSAPWASHDHPTPQFPLRLSEYVRRQLFSPSGFESGGPSTGNYTPLHSGAASTQDMVLPSGTRNQGLLHPRPALWMDRQGGTGAGLSYSLRTLAAIGEGNGSNRLVSEQIRNVLGLMRRGDNLRFEDVMILDQTVFSGVADIHDRHRDMRLDVDNMSYEELLALEERIGNVSTGLSEEIIQTRLKPHKYSPLESQPEAEASEPCCICQEEYNDGEDLGKLECGHDFHAHCIKQWLIHKNLCPICKTTALAT